MGTRAAAFTAKIRNLHDYQLRLLHGIMPVPSGVDIANTLKYFSQTLLTVLKDVPDSPLEMLKCQEKDGIRMSLYPNLDYRGLFNAVVQLVDIAPLIQFGLHAFGQAILQCVGCILPFLEQDMIDALPYTAASTIAVLPSTLHQEIVNSLCFYILPFTITRGDDNDGEQETFARQSVAAIVMMIFQYSDNPAHHCQLLECLMATKKNVVKDLLCVIAYGTSSARSSAAKLLFYYWPTFNPVLFDRRVVLQKVANDFVPFVCQRDMCPSAGNAEAAKVCFDHCISITFASDSPPPLYLCIECANEIHREHPNQMFFDILHPMQQVSMTCENKNCRGTDKYAISICFSTECASYNGNHPIRYCQQCHSIRHNNRRGMDHIVHKSLPYIWDMDTKMKSYLVEAIVSLLKEAKPLSIEVNRETSDIHTKATLLNVLNVADNIPVEERQLLGRYGVWLLVGLCTPNETKPVEILGRLLAMLFHWFDITAYSFDDQIESTLERLKVDFVCDWLSQLRTSHFKIFVSCLLPHPADYARVGGHWDTLVSRTAHLKDGLNRLFCLVPYEVITIEIWDYIMPHWMEAMVNDVPGKELPELKMLLSKMLDADMSPLGFDTKKLYRFVSVRFKKTSTQVQEQALNWLQVLTMLEIVIPLHLLFSMFSDGVRVMKGGTKEESDKQMKSYKNGDTGRHSSISPVVEDESGNTSGFSDEELPAMRHMHFETDAERNLSCCILMLDILLNQLELQKIERHTGVTGVLSQDVCQLLKAMVAVSWRTGHTCRIDDNDQCVFCESCVMWYQLALELVKLFAPQQPAHLPDFPIDEQNEDSNQQRKSPPELEKKAEPKPDVVINMPIPDIPSVGGVLVHMPHIMTATVETVTEQLDLAPIIPTERVVAAVARAVTLTDTDVATATVQVAKPTLVGENDEPIDTGKEEELSDFWHTSVGKFRFSLEELPQQLQFIHQLLQELPNTEEPNILYYMLQCLHILCLHGDALTKAAKDQPGFLIWCQENLTIKNLWDLCSAEHSHICQVCVPLLLHCVTLPSGSDVFWPIVQREFQSTDWRVRFVAVERVTVIARFMDSTPLRNIQPLQSALANAFCYLISSMDDANVEVAQRATLYLGTLHDTAIKALIFCLEAQFDSVIVDRPVVLQSLYQLHNTLSDRRILTWEFFLNRFDALFLEAQINLEKSGDISYLRDLRNTDLNSEAFMRKLHRAHEALSQQCDGSTMSTMKTLSASFGAKWPYKRTMSAPASIVSRTDIKQEKEKVYNRQYSAPILKRKSSRFGLGQLLESFPPSTRMADGHIHSLGGTDDGNFLGFLNRVINLEESDHETMHLLIFLMMQFLSRADQAYPSDEKIVAKTQNIVLRHLYLLLGYNQNEKVFHIPPQRLRMSPVFNAFLANLPQLLDQNQLMGCSLLPTCLVLLQYCPCPHHPGEFQVPAYSLWFLEPHTRRSWLMAVLVLMYKYQYNQPPHSGQLQSLIKIVLNTLDSQHHQCRHIPATLVMGTLPSRSEDLNQPSLGGDIDGGGQGGCGFSSGNGGLINIGSGNTEKLDTPPLSPLFPEEVNPHIAVTPRAGKITTLHHQRSLPNFEIRHHTNFPSKSSSFERRMPESSYSIEAETTESELAAIPESPKSDSTLHGSIQGSSEDECLPMAVENTTAYHQRKVITPVNNGGQCSQNLANYSGKQNAHGNLKPLLTFNSGNSTHQQSNKSSNNTNNSVVTMCNSSAVTTPESYKACSHNSTENQQYNSITRSLGKQKCLYELTNINMLAQQLPWQIDIPKQTERLLPIGTARLVPKNVTSSLQSEDTYSSPESPLSKMDVMTVGSPMDIDSENNVSSEVASTCSASHLEFPVPERLLPVGPKQKDLSSLVEHVKHALSIVSDCPNTPDLKSTELETFASTIYLRQDSFEKSETQCTSPTANREESTHGVNLRRLIKQTAVDSPPPHIQGELEDYHSSSHRIVQYDRKTQIVKADDDVYTQKQWSGKSGTFAAGQRVASDKHQQSGPWCRPQTSVLDPLTQQACHAEFHLKQSSFRTGDECVYERCSECGLVKEEYSDEEMGLCIIILGTFIHREPALAAPLLPEILSIVSKIALNATYPWQAETNIYLPGGAISVAHQFLRCVLHQLAPNGVFVQMFQTNVEEHLRMQFFKSVTQALLDFPELNVLAPLQLLLEALNARKSLPSENLGTVLWNVACYLDCLPAEAGAGLWGGLLSQLELLLRRLSLGLSVLPDPAPLLRIASAALRAPGITTCKGLLDPFSKVVSFAIQNHAIKYNSLFDLCYLCNRAFTREREKLILTRMVVFELIQALKFKTSIPDSNIIMLINFVLQDAGSSLPVNMLVEHSFPVGPEGGPVYNTNASECMRHHLGDSLEFLADFHTLSKVKSYCKGMAAGLNEDTLGGVLKSGIAQFLALEITRGNSRDSRAVSRYLPWLYNAPSALQQGPREFIECVGHIRLLSWLLLGALTHTALHSGSVTSHTPCQPVPQEASCHIADHIQVIMAGFAEQSKASVLHMSSLFHAFILCQLWTVYLEQIASHNLPSSEAHSLTMSILFDFWGKVTPCILHLVAHSKVLAEMVNLHFLSLLEALLECNSAVLSKLLPIWSPVLFAYHIQLPGHLHVRLQGCRNFPPVVTPAMPPPDETHSLSNIVLLRWLQRLQFKMGQIELQSSAATQFYSV
ncbi:protein unc-79 homolog [Schistocerca serialis cubense]|uniref:protein unc-79 homolog n=1 Tax=Schistocerca serialis cubense TaxID=2023355 RepID=UPI00214F1CE0|nr:protein unc-79 homolog [Schistocerca serialis cubense]